MTQSAPKGNIRAMTYDGLNRLSTVTDDPQGLKLTTRHEYDVSDNLRSQYDAKGNHVEFTYDALNRKTGHIQYKNAIGTIISCPSIQALRQESLEQPKDRSEGRQGWMNLRLKICSPRPSSNVFP